MRLLSPFQILPYHIVELILDHVAGSSRLQFDNVTKGSKGYTALLVPLLSVCRDFRTAVLARYCRVHTLDLSCFSDQIHDKKALWPERLRRIDFPTHLHAQELDITLGGFSVYNGTALKELLRAPHGGFLFPKVRSLKVTLIQTTREKRLLTRVPTELEIEPNIRAFVQRIRLVAPMTRGVCISLLLRSSNESQFVIQHFGSLANQLGQLGNTIEHHYNCRPLALEPPSTGISSLTLECFCEGSDGLVAQLTRYNAATLQTLSFSLRETKAASLFIQSNCGGYVEYPHLQELKIEQIGDWVVGWEPQPPMPVFPGAIPFPKLQRLSLKSEYPFGDDAPFRGNASTLEYLYLGLSAGLVRVLREGQVFSRNSHPKLLHVCSTTAFWDIHDLFDSDSSYMAFVLSIGSNACVRDMGHLLSTQPFLPVVSLLGEYTCIRVLVLGSIFLDFWGVIALVKALPLLSDLYLKDTAVGGRPVGVFKHTLPAYVIANYTPVSERFRCLQLVGTHDGGVKAIVKSVLLLALVCPNFDYAVLARDRELFMAHMKKTIATDGFRPYAKRLRRLLFGGWKDKIPSVATLNKRPDRE